MKIFLTKFGFSLVEMLIYVSVLSVIFLVIVNTSLSFVGSYRTLSALRAADHGGIDALEPITRAIRGADTIVGTGNSLTLSETNSGIATTTLFSLVGGTINETVTVNGVQNNSLSGPLTASDVNITALTFTALATSTASAVKIDMTTQATSGTVTKTKNFHSTVVLHG